MFSQRKSRLWVWASLAVALVISSRAGAEEPIPETVSLQTTFPQVCPKYKWMTWPTYESWYAIYHVTECATMQPVNFDCPTGTMPMNCPNCVAAKIVVSVSDASGGLRPVGVKQAPVPPPQKTKPTHQPGTKLGEKLPNVKIKKLEDDVAEPKYKLNKQATTHDYVTFFILNADGERQQVYAVLRHIRLERRKNATGDLTDYPPVMLFDVGQEIAADATEDDSPRDPEFIQLPQGSIEMLDGNVLNVSLVGATFQVVTSTEVSGIPAEE